MNRGLLVGINDYPLFPLWPLTGCVNDVTDLGHFVVNNCNFSSSDFRLLPDAKATKEAIIEGLGWLLNGLRAGDRILFHYSGHGLLVPRLNPLSLHDAVCPVDFDWTTDNAITDTDFQQKFRLIPDGVEFVWVSDSCFSGQLIGEMQRLNARPKRIPPPPEIELKIQEAQNKGIQPLGFEGAVTNLNVALMAACKWDQLSYEVPDGSNSVFTRFLINQLEKDGLKVPLTKIISDVCAAIAAAGYSQVPQLKGAASIKNKGFLAP